MSKSKFALGALIGALGGAIAGVLLAPKSGRETRAELREKAGGVAADVSKKVKNCCPECREFADGVVDKAQDIAGDVKEGAIDLKARTGRAVEGAKKGFFGK